MAQGNIAKCLPITLAHEGGMSTVRADPGNWTGGKVGVGVLKGTKYGIAASSYPNLDIKNLTIQDVTPIYKRNYWDKVRGDDLPAGVDLTVFDYGVNSGPSRAIKEFQRALGVSADGIIGPETMRRFMEPTKIIKSVNARRMSFLRGLAIFKTFGKGWTRRVADIEAKSVAMWLAAGGTPKTVATDKLKTEAKKANQTAASQNKGAAGTAGAGTAGGGMTAAADVNWLLIGGIIVAVVVVAGVLILKARQNKERAAAYDRVASVAV